VFSFEFAALNYTSSDKNQYAYKLEGFDNDWIYCGTRRYATYTNLDGGEYIFRVKGSNNDGVWNETGTSIAVIITPPFWVTWWFRGFAFITMFVSIGGGIRYVEMRKLKRRIERLEQERALERERTRISQDMHDEVGAGLTEIGILSELAKSNIQDPGEAAKHIQRVAETSRETIASIGEIIWAINPKNDLLDDVVAYLRHFAARYLGSTAIKLEFDTPETVPDFHLSAEARRNIFLVVKEAIHNIVKHSQATAVFITISFTKEHLDILVKDNGKGFSSEDFSRFGNGLRNMERRIKNIGGTFVIESKPGEGTRVAIAVEL
jgi:signal transduction histidine kinase